MIEPPVGLVLLHPLGSDGTFWEPIRDLLGACVWCPDLLGHGAAPLPSLGAGITGLSQAVVADWKASGRGSATLIGVSLGGLVAQDVASRHPELVETLVLVDTVATYPDALRLNWHERARVARNEGLLPLADAMEAMWFTDDFRQRWPHAVRQVRDRFLAGDPEGYARTCEALAGADLTGRLAGSAVPTLIICGDQDAPAFVAAAPELVAGIRDAELLWLVGAKHAAVLEQPEAFAAGVLDFLARRRN